jgi:hypothetical protein
VLVTELVVLVGLVLAGAVYLSWTAGRIDRLHARVEAARNALDAQLVRRAAAARALASYALAHGLLHEEGDALLAASAVALQAPPRAREAAENDLSRALRRALAALPGETSDFELGRLLDELEIAVTRVGLARTFHNEAVRDTRSLRGRRVPRLFRLAGHAALPQYFEIDDTALTGPGRPQAPERR